MVGCRWPGVVWWSSCPGMSNALLSLDGSCKVKVSSVLGRDVKQYGKKFMLDGAEDTCWNSDQGASQSVTVEFPHPVSIAQIEIRFQGGFAAQECTLLASLGGEELQERAGFNPQDTNSLQVFEVEDRRVGDHYKIVFTKSTDFFGRIIVYSLQFYGRKHTE